LKSTVKWKQYYRILLVTGGKPFLVRDKNCSLIRDLQNKLPFMQAQQFIDMLTGKFVALLLQNSFIYTQGNMYVHVNKPPLLYPSGEGGKFSYLCLKLFKTAVTDRSRLFRTENLFNDV
jgi:hypothetical protein